MVRKSKITPEIINEVKDCIRLGMSYAATAGAIGITPDTFYNWMAWGKEGKAPYASLYGSVREAEAHLMQDCLLKLRKAADLGNIESIRFILERRFPRDWGKQENLNINQKTEAVNVNITPELKQSEADKIRAEILAKLSSPAYPERLNVTNSREY